MGRAINGERFQTLLMHELSADDDGQTRKKKMYPERDALGKSNKSADTQKVFTDRSC